MVTSELTGEISMGVLLVFLVFWRRGQYIVPDQQGDTASALVLDFLSPEDEILWGRLRFAHLLVVGVVHDLMCWCVEGGQQKLRGYSMHRETQQTPDKEYWSLTRQLMTRFSMSSLLSYNNLNFCHLGTTFK